MAIEVKNETIQIERYELGPFGTNSYILTCLKTGDSVVVDAPGDAPKILAQLQDTNPKYILMTHNHMDHTGADCSPRRRCGQTAACTGYDVS